MTELPYQAEYAKTGRAGCKGCKKKIDQGALRIAIMVQSAFFDGKQPNWHHENCFFSKQHPATFNDIANFNKLTNRDQTRIKSKIENYSGAVMPDEPDAGGKAKGKGKKRAADSGNSQALKDYGVEYSKSSRASCRHCDIKICKDEVRIRKTVYDTEIGNKYGGQPLWHHVNCFAEKRSELMFFAGGESLPGFKELNEDDQKMVQDAIKPFKKDEVPIKILKSEPKDDEELEAEKQKEALIVKQNKLFQKNKKALSDLKKKEVQEILELNEQEVNGGPDERLDHLADCLTFGALLPCPECKHGQLVLDSFGYKCTGNLSEWTKCSYVTQEPKRELMRVPKVCNNKPKIGVRLFPAAPRPVVIVKDEPITSINSEMPVPPLKNFQFFLYGKLKNKEETKRRILKLGGLVVGNLTDTMVAVVSTKKDVWRMPDKMQEIEKLDVVVVEDTFLDSIDPKGTIVNSLQIIKENNIAQWGADPAARLPQEVLDGKSIPKSGSMFVKSSKSASVKLKIQGGTAVDPESGLADVAHVYQARDGTKYTVVLTQTDIVAQKNSYYKMQVLKMQSSDDKPHKYWLFRSWGRIGTTIGGSKVEQFSSAKLAVNKFETIYEEKTENPWEMRHDFMKVPGRYFPLDVDYSDGTDDAKLDLEVDAKSKLPEPVQKLIIKIFDVKYMKKTMLEFELDTEKMPLGKLSKNQLKSGYKVLSELLKLIEKGKTSQSKIIDATNRFFTLIPHDFGVKNAPLLDNVETIKTKTEMLDNLLEIEIAYSLLKSEGDESVGVIDAHFLKLKCDIAPILKESPEYQLISEYLRNTHASTHSHYKLEIEEVFKVVREGEDKRFKPFKKLHNRRLLWHGSRITNFAGILSQGLRIAPPEAPVTGYMFGKGIYFADMVSKSANYCYTSTTNPIGVLMLCEVALGTMQECYAARNVKLSPHEHSAWGVGRTQPDPALSRTLDDVLVPLGTPLTSPTDTSLLYNEFIVYDVAQVNVKYLLQVKFKY